MISPENDELNNFECKLAKKKRDKNAEFSDVEAVQKCENPIKYSGFEFCECAAK